MQNTLVKKVNVCDNQNMHLVCLKITSQVFFILIRCLFPSVGSIQAGMEIMMTYAHKTFVLRGQ